MNSLYNLGLRQTQSLQNDLDSMAQAVEPSASLQGQIGASLAAFSRTVEDYDSMAKQEIVAVKKEKALQRVSKFRDDYVRYRNQFTDLKKQLAQQQASATRAALFTGANGSSSPTTRHRTSSIIHTSASNGVAPNGFQSQQRSELFSTNAQQSSTSESPFSFRPNNPRQNHALREDTFINNTESQLDELIAKGQEIWGGLKEQKGWLKGTQKRLLDAANGIKGGRQVVGWVERRSTQDRWILGLGSAFTLFMFWVIWHYLG